MERILSEHWSDYELIDIGDNKKIERWGETITIRPDRNSYFKAVLSYKEWKRMAHFEFIETSSNKGHWKHLKNNHSPEWIIRYKSIVFNLKLTKFKHIGIFPEQQANWSFIEKNIRTEDQFLNLFAYTGAASLVARSKGAQVYHCDSLKQIISWARMNMISSKLENVHWVLDDALKFALREVKRNKRYRGLIMDPPAFGRGKNGEAWRIEDNLQGLIKMASELLDEKGFLILNTYTPKMDAKRIEEMLHYYFPSKSTSAGKLSSKSATGKVLDFGEVYRVK